MFFFFFLFFFLLIMKGMTIIEVEVHSTCIFGLGTKTNIARWHPPPYPLLSQLTLYPTPR